MLMQAEVMSQEWAAVAWGVNGGLDTLLRFSAKSDDTAQIILIQQKNAN